ncbi:protein rolling stone-like [Lineus longissimus]|uniref:protein rolling stone-like n=1 Tax=Lineus longissimus TaxID=88925 RepID=UPI00315D9C71
MGTYLCPWCLKEEFSWSNLGLNCDNPSLFLTSQWPRFSEGCFVIYRVVLAMVVTAWLVFNIIDEVQTFYYNDVKVWFAYATNWGFLLLGIILVLLAIQSLVYYCCQKKLPKDGSLPANIKFTWMLYNMASNSNLVISICFWVFLVFMDNSFYFGSIDSETKHSFNSVVILMDLFVTATPIRLLHFIYPVSLGLLYAFFNIVYFLMDGPGPDGRNHYVYAVMDWNKPGTATGAVFLGLGLSLVCQIVLFGLYKLRVFIHDKCYSSKEYGDEMNKIIEDEDNHNYDSIQKEDDETTH